MLMVCTTHQVNFKVKLTLRNVKYFDGCMEIFIKNLGLHQDKSEKMILT